MSTSGRRVSTRTQGDSAMPLHDRRGEDPSTVCGASPVASACGKVPEVDARLADAEPGVEQPGLAVLAHVRSPENRIRPSPWV